MNNSEINAQISAVILDLDGTLLNTEVATKDVLKNFLGKYGKVLDMEKEDKRFGITMKQAAVAIVMDYDLPLSPSQFLDEITPMYKERWPLAKPLPGANRLIMHLYKHQLPFALASNSLSGNIEEKISHRGWKEYFSVILGCDQVKAGKPAPYIFEEAAKRMGIDASCCLVIEDSLVGVEAAKAAKMKVVAVPSLESQAYCDADLVLNSLLEFQPELWGLEPFDDWVNNALPVDSICFECLYRNGCLFESAAMGYGKSDDGISGLPTQVSGIYFGWAKSDDDEIFKVVTGIGLSCYSSTEKRKIQLCVIDGDGDHIYDQHMQIVLVGYIRGLNTKGNTSRDIEILEEDKSIAEASLDLPEFAHHSSLAFF